MFHDIYKYTDISVFYLAILNCFFHSTSLGYACAPSVLQGIISHYKFPLNNFCHLIIYSV